MTVKRSGAYCPLAGLVFIVSEMGAVAGAGGLEPRLCNDELTEPQVVSNGSEQQGGSQDRQKDVAVIAARVG